MNIDFMKYGDEQMWDVCSEITRQYLIDCYRTMQIWPDEPDFQKISKALKRTIKYVSTPDQWKEFENAL